MPKPRSLILDLYGDYLRYIAEEIRAVDLIALMSVLGVEPATTRVTLSRLRQEGWFTTRRVGRETLYRLSDHLFAVLDEGRGRIFAPYPVEWSGRWTQIVFQAPEGDRTEREDLRKRLAWLGFGPLTATVWLSPRPFEEAELDRLRAGHPQTTIEILRSRSEDEAQDRRLVTRCWDVEALNADYRRFIGEHRGLVRATAGFTGADAFLGSVSLISIYRHFPFRDPGLPEALRPDGWLGAEADELFRTLHDALRPAATDYVRTLIKPVPGSGDPAPDPVPGHRAS